MEMHTRRKKTNGYLLMRGTVYTAISFLKFTKIIKFNVGRAVFMI